MKGNQSIRTIRSLKCGIVHEDFDVPSNAIQCENKLIHEHDFVTARIKETNSSLIHCITCGIYYCQLCGKALEDKVTNHECAILKLPIANEVAGHVIADRRSVIDIEPIMDTVFIYRKKAAQNNPLYLCRALGVPLKLQ
jgi:hypothetical protein